jgi:hypothetical protein
VTGKKEEVKQEEDLLNRMQKELENFDIPNE